MLRKLLVLLIAIVVSLASFPSIANASYLNSLGNKKLKEISILGSHDSGMSVFGAHTATRPCNTLTQSQNILGQLNLGAVYFDIRPVISGGAYFTGHYSDFGFLGWQGANGQSIDSIISQINDFTSENKQLVVLSLSHAYNTDVGRHYRSFNQGEWNQLFSKLSQINSLYVNSNPNNVDLTSLTVNDFIQNSPAVVVVVDEPGVKLGKYQGNGFYRSSSFNVYDKYSDTNNLNEMANGNEKGQIPKMKQMTGKQYFLLSWTLTQSSTQAALCPWPESSIIELAKTANDALPSMLLPSVSKSAFPNIIYVDNIDSQKLEDVVIKANCKVFPGFDPYCPPPISHVSH